MLLKSGNKYVNMDNLECLSVLWSVGNLDVIAVDNRKKQTWYVVRDNSDCEYYYLLERYDCTVNHKGVRLDICPEGEQND